MPANMKNAFGRLRGAARSAFDRTSRTSGQPADPDLKLYNTLGEQEFQRIAQQYGQDKTIEYIRKMEARKMITGGKYGS